MFFLGVAMENPMNLFDTLRSLFENNVVNWLLLTALLVWLVKKQVPALLSERRLRIESALNDAHAARQESVAFLESQQKRLAEAVAEANKILSEAQGIAASMKQQIEENSKKEMAALEQKIVFEVENEKRAAITQLRTAAAHAAVQLAREKLPSAVNDKIKQGLLSKFLKEFEESKN